MWTERLFKEIVERRVYISVIGLGYVGMPIAIAFADKLNVIGFDINKEKVELYKKGFDPTNEVGDEGVKACNVEFTSCESDIKKSRFHIVAVPTPVNQDHTPDLSPVETATRRLARNLEKGSVVVYESTVYPGVTEEICVPILEEISGLKSGEDFKVGYSPERINPGDKKHRLNTITKVVSGMDDETLEIVAKVYGLVVDAGVYRADSIKVAEAAKVIENSQRDINIAFMNELSIIFNKMGIDTRAVLEAAGTKWNFLKFSPGLVGGHCIGVDPYYLTYRAEMLGYHSQIILAGRRINDDMGKYIAEICVKQLIKADRPVKRARVGVLGFTFKENCPDTRNTKVIDIVNELGQYGIVPQICDPVADNDEVHRLYNINLTEESKLTNLDALVIAVSHDEFRHMTSEDISKFFGTDGKILMDIKGIFNRREYTDKGYIYWSM
ncbi:MAG: nucleotide sugar dehydrogenase [Lachnospiraceae bacterium]|nr:nucleotide sugar dehydrogenase [Lachnospiraceae bacterium]